MTVELDDHSMYTLKLIDAIVVLCVGVSALFSGNMETLYLALLKNSSFKMSFFLPNFKPRKIL